MKGYLIGVFVGWVTYLISDITSNDFWPRMIVWGLTSGLLYVGMLAARAVSTSETEVDTEA